MKFTEYQLEKAFIELLQSEDIPHVNGGTISRDFQEVIFEDDLKTFLLTQYQKEKLTSTEARNTLHRNG